MTEKSGIIAIIPARGGSKGISGKNIKLLAGKPLIAYSIEAALESKYFDRIILSTDKREIAEVADKFGAEVILRPAELATDTTPTAPVLEHVVRHLEQTEKYRTDVVVLLQPTSPLRNSQHINQALDTFFENQCDSLLSVCPSHAFFWRIHENQPSPLNYDFRKRPRRQDRESEYKENGAIYVIKSTMLMMGHSFLGGKIGLYVMPEEYSTEIDSEFDFWLCEKVISDNYGK